MAVPQAYRRQLLALDFAYAGGKPVLATNILMSSDGYQYHASRKWRDRFIQHSARRLHIDDETFLISCANDPPIRECRIGKGKQE